MKYSNVLIDLVKTKSITQLARNKKYLHILEHETNFLTKFISPSNRIGYVLSNTHEIKLCEICKKNEVEFKISQNRFATCSRSCGGKKSGLTMSQVNNDGISIKQKSAQNRLKTLAKIDPITGISKAESIEAKRQHTMSQIDPTTGLKRSASAGLKTKASLNKIDPITGLSPSQAKEKQRHKTLSKIDPKTGLTGHQKARQVQWNTMSELDDNGNPKYQESRAKQHITMSYKDPETGLSGIDIQNNKSKHTKLKINTETGLNGYQTGELQRHHTMSQIDPETGKSFFDGIAKKRYETLSKIDPDTGLTGHEKLYIVQNIRGFKLRTMNFPKDYKLLSSESQYIKDKHFKFQCIKCSNIFKEVWSKIRCTTCYPHIISNSELEVLEFCKSLDQNIISNTRKIIKPLELDIYIPNHNLAIEYNGIYWHSTEFKSKDYHLNKTEQCKSKGIQLFHIFENEWQDDKKQEIWKSIIRNKLGFSDRIFARKTIVTKITSKDTKEFLDSNHLQGACMSSVNLGLLFDDKLVTVMTFGRSRYDKKVDWELLRFCNKLGYSVIGGASKLLAQFQREHDGSIISYADKRRSNGNLYEKLGFELSHESAPNYWYWKNDGLESRIGYQKHKLKDKLELFDENLTESENMSINGYRKIYDCGNQVWKLP